MPVFAVELDDRAVSLARDGRVLSSAPSAVFNGTAGSAAGINAWRELRSRPMATSSRHLGAVLTQRGPWATPRARRGTPGGPGTPGGLSGPGALSATRGGQSALPEYLVEAELRARLAEDSNSDGESVWVVVPALAEPRGLEALLGITRQLGLRVDGFVDCAAVTAAALGSERDAIVLELGLHHAAVTAVACEAGQARRRRSVLTERGGLVELYQTWLDLISKTMVKRTRFDPLHDATTEQQLFDALPALAREVAATGSATAVVSKGRERFDVALTRDQFAQAAQILYRSVVSLVHQLRPAGSPVAIVVPDAVAEFPGMRELLEQFVGCELVGIPDGFAAAAASLIDLPMSAAGQEAVRLLRRLPLQSESAVAGRASRQELGQRRAGGPSPSHVLLDGRAYSLGSESLVVGRAPEPVADGGPSRTDAGPSRADGGPSRADGAAGRADGGLSRAAASAQHITLPDGLAGVSRRHCTFVRDGDELILLDHSTYGTFVNGERVQERVRVHAGDRVRLGEPGVELALIAVGEVTAITQQS
jgi:hypothetical protein